MAKTIRVAAIQVRPSTVSVRDTIFHAVKLGIRAAEQEADILCLPEHWLPEKTIPPDMDPLPALQSLAEEYGVFIVGGGYFERVKGRLYISSPFIRSDGTLAGKQFKVHLFRREKSVAKPGRSYQTFKADGYKVGILVCYDETFPEAARTLALEGVDIIFCPSRIIRGGVEPWHLYLTVRALENRIPIVAPNVYAPPYFLGGSIILSLVVNKKTMIAYPRSKVIGKRTGVIVQDIDLDFHKRLRQDRLGERMPAAYSPKLTGGKSSK